MRLWPTPSKLGAALARCRRLTLPAASALSAASLLSASAALSAAACLAGCAGRSFHSEEQRSPVGSDFFQYPEKYRGATVRLVNLSVERVDITRPLVLRAEAPRAGSAELLVSDGRSLASKQSIKVGDHVTVLIECTEGRPERGNLLLQIDPYPAP